MPPAPIPDPAAPLRQSLALQGQAVEVARGILAVFDAHQGQFLLVTRRAEARFRQRDQTASIGCSIKWRPSAP